MNTNSAEHASKKNFIQQMREVMANETNVELWYDWFCKSHTLPERQLKLVSFLKEIVLSPRFKAEEVYIFFKNNCPMTGPTYDSASICDIKTGDVLYFISTGDKRSEFTWEISCRETNFEKQTGGTRKQAIAFFMGA